MEAALSLACMLPLVPAVARPEVCTHKAAAFNGQHGTLDSSQGTNVSRRVMDGACSSRAMRRSLVGAGSGQACVRGTGWRLAVDSGRSKSAGVCVRR